MFEAWKSLAFIGRRERKELGKHRNDAFDSPKPFMQYFISDDEFLSMCDCGITVTAMLERKRADCLSQFLTTRMSKCYGTSV
jgi:hypothetical protein